MISSFNIPEPFQFNPLKHHLLFIKEYFSHSPDVKSDTGILQLVKEMKHIGTSVMDVYNGNFSVKEICSEVAIYLEMNQLIKEDFYSAWTGTGFNDFRLMTLSDSSQWILKYHIDVKRFVHIFPARSSPHTFRVKANTLKSALLYHILIGKDYVTGDNLNKVRSLLGLSPIKNPDETAAIYQMIEILRY